MKKLPDYINSYIEALEVNGKNEIYETFTLMILNNEFLEELDKLVIKSIQSINNINNKVTFQIYDTERFNKLIESISKSKYFLDNFEHNERIRKAFIIKNILFEITSKTIMESIAKDIDSAYEDLKFNINLKTIEFPYFSHKHMIDYDRVRKTVLTFPNDATIPEINQYIKENYLLRPRSKKRKLSLGKGIKLLEIDEEFKSKKHPNKESAHEYHEQLISREFTNRHNKNISTDATKKTIQRTKNIIREINKKGTNR